jgi:hypothetical protein
VLLKIMRLADAKRVRLFCLCCLLLVPAAAPDSAQPDSLADLQRAFENPPADSRIMMRWWWFGPSVTKPELEREMNLMKQGGIGGFEVQPVYPLGLDDPGHGFHNYPYLSDEFIDALSFTSEKSRELGLRVDLTLGSGWPSGGPHTPITEAAGKLRYEIVSVPEQERRVPLPYIVTGEKLLGAFVAPGTPKNFSASNAREIGDIRGGAVHLPADLGEGPHVVLFFIAGRTGMMVKRAAFGAEGFVLDHYDRAAVEDHLTQVGDRLMQAFGPNPPHAVFCDSLEVYGSDWTSDFLAEFQKRRGYDLKPYLPALISDVGDKTSAVRHDWGQTLTELFEDRFLVPVEAWARHHHTLFRAQLYGIPPAALSSYRLIDLGEGEGAHWKQFAPTRWASSANHLYGRAVTSSETWTWLHSPPFRATPLDMKAEADVHFLEGINQLVGHGWPYSPPSAGSPGWSFYAAAVFNQNNPWWLVMPDITRYLQRISFLLRQGRPVNDVAIYVPTDDAWASFSPGKVSIDEAMNGLLGPDLIPSVLEAGYNFDFIDDTAIQQVGKVEQGSLSANASRYRIIILPGVERISVATLRKLEDFARNGGTLIATRRRPSLAPGLEGREEQGRQIHSIVQDLFEVPSAPAHFVDDERRQLVSLLAKSLAPDVAFSSPAPDIGFVHRSTPFAEIYFLANTGNQRVQTQAVFRVTEMEPEWWDPFTAKVYRAGGVSHSKNSTTITVDLEPYESRVLMFTHRLRPGSSGDGVEASPPEPLDLSGGWNVSFGEAAASLPMDHLQSWTDNAGTRFFSGQATYEKTVSIPAGALQEQFETRLDFGPGTAVERTEQHGNGIRAWYEGPVREAAVVFVNGRRAGSVWHPPYTLDVTPFLHPGENTFRIVVANLAINQIAGRALPDYRLLNLRYGERFTPEDKKDIQPLPSGLLGAIRLITEHAQKPLPLP